MMGKLLSSRPMSRAAVLRRTVFFSNLALLAVSVVLLYLRPAEGFEESLYSASGTLVWILLSFVLASSICTIFLTILASEFKSEFPSEMLVILGTAGLIILLSPFIRSYEGYGRSDSMGHVGYALDIVAERQLAIDPYPAVHMLQGVFSSVSGLHPATLARYASVFVYLTYWCGLYLLAGQCFPKGNGRLLSMLFGLPLIYSSFHVEVLALTFSASFMPFLVYLWIRAHKSSQPLLWRICWVVFCLGISLFHPLFALLLVAALVGSSLWKWLSSVRTDEPSGGARGLSSLSKTPFASVVFIVIIVLCLWLWRNWSVWSSAVWQTEAAIQDPLSYSTLAREYGQVERARMTVPDLVLMSVRIYGHLLIYAILSAYAVLSLLFRNGKKLQNPSLREIATWFVGLALGSVVGLLSGLGIWRLLQVALSLSPVLIASIWSSYGFPQSRRRGWTVALLALVAIFVYVNAMLAFFPDPYTHRVSSHVTSAELDGMEWFLENMEDYPTRSVTWRMRQFSRFLFGTSFEDTNLSAIVGYYGELPVAAHFDFANSAIPNNVQEFYVPISQYDRSYHLRVFRASERFTEPDFEWLSGTQAASLIYSNGDLDIFLVHTPVARR